MEIKQAELIIDSTYFRISEVRPRVVGNAIEIVDFEGRRRRWGRPACITTVAVHEADFVATHVGFFHKHGGGQGWHYFVLGENGRPRRVTARQLDLRQRIAIWHAFEEMKAWVKPPFKRPLRTLREAVRWSLECNKEEKRCSS